MNEFPKCFKTTVLGMGPYCVEFEDGEIITTRSEVRQKLIAATENRWLNFTDEELMHQNHIYEMVDTEFRCLTEYELKFWDEFKAELERRKK